MKIIIKNAMIVDEEGTTKADLKIESGKISEIGNFKDENADEIVDAKNKYVLPGLIDAHTHFDLFNGIEYTSDNFETGTKAAVLGGNTTIIDYMTQEKGKSLSYTLNLWHQKAKNSFCDYGFHMGIVEWNDSIKNEIKVMKEEGVTSFKMYLAYKKNLQVSDEVLFEALKESKKQNVLFTFHCENGDIIEGLIKDLKSENKLEAKYHPMSRPSEVEKESISKIISMAKILNVPIYIVHLSSKEGLWEIQRAKESGVNIFVETCPQYLFLNEKVYQNSNEALKYIISPPLRDEGSNLELKNAIKIGDIDVIATDHCSFSLNQKQRFKHDFTKIPNGAAGVEHRLAMVYTNMVCENKITINKMISLLSTKPAKIFGLYPKKGTLKIGSDADILIFNPEKNSIITKENQNQNVDYTIFEGFKTKGEIEAIYLRGQKIVENGKYIQQKANGVFLKRS